MNKSLFSLHSCNLDKLLRSSKGSFNNNLKLWSTKIQCEQFNKDRIVFYNVQRRFNSTTSIMDKNDTPLPVTLSAPKKRNIQFTLQVIRILELSKKGNRMHPNNKARLVDFMKKKKSLSKISRTHIVNALFKCAAYDEILDIYNINSDEEPLSKFPEDISVDEQKYIFRSLVIKNHDKLDTYVTALITKHSSNVAAKNTVLIPVLNSLLKEIYDQRGFETYLSKWISYISFMQGHIYFGDRYVSNRLFLKPFKFVLNEEISKRKDSTKNVSYCAILNNLKTNSDISSRNLTQFISTFLTVLINNQEWEIAKQVFDYKMLKFEDSLVETDLNCCLQIYSHFNNYTQLIEIYRKYPHLHNIGPKQFDYILLSLSKLEDWNGLQKQFDDLFYIGELPNIIHYGIIMSKVAKTGHVEIVDKLFNQLIDRGLIPNFHVIQSLVIASYNAGSHFNLIKNFQLFEKYELKPTAVSYLYMLKSFRRKNDLEGCLRILKKIDKSLLNESHFLQLVLIAFHIKNYKIAEEIFSVMKDDFKIRPTTFFISKIMQVYNASGEPGRVLELFDKYNAKTANTPKRINLYNQKLLANVLMKNEESCQQTLQDIRDEGLKPNSEFNLMMLKYFTRVQDNVGLSIDFIKQVHETNPRGVLTAHFEEVMFHIDRRLSSKNIQLSIDRIFELYKFQLDKRISVSSTILTYVIKYAYLHNINKFRSGSQLDQFIILTKSFIDKFADKSLDTVDPVLHPKILFFPIKAMSSINPDSSKELIEYFIEKCYVKQVDKDDIYTELSLLKTKLYFSFNTSEWDNVSYFFDRILENLFKLRSLPYYDKGVNKNIQYFLIDIIDIKLRQLEAQNQLGSAMQVFKYIKNKLKLKIDNSTYNLMAKLLVGNKSTIGQGLKLVENYLIHGHQLVHKMRLLRKIKTPAESLSLRFAEQDPEDYKPRVYLRSEDYHDVLKSMDHYLIELDDFDKMEEVICEWCSNYPQTMVRYMMKPRSFPHWEEFEKNRKKFLDRIREQKYFAK